jgi:eukaryotic translation initiation factor 2C
MIKDTCADPESRFRMVQENVLQACKDPVSASFGLQTDQQGLMRINARVLEPLNLSYRDLGGNEAIVQPEGPKGKWTMKIDGQDCHMARPCEEVVDWLIVSYVPEHHVRRPQLDYFLQQVITMAAQRGMRISPHYETMLGDPDRGVESQLRQAAEGYLAAKGRPLQLLFCVMPDRGSQTYLYPAVKRWANTSGGVPSQCVQAQKLLKRDQYGVQYLSNLLLKLNIKLGGHNHYPSPSGCKLSKEKPTIVLGADVYHAPPDSDRASFAAVVGSMDRWLGAYYSTVAAQQARKEVIVDMENLMIMQLQRFYELNRVAPQRIIFYRDGVGNAQFEMIRRNEIYSIRRACTAVGGASYRPELIFIVVQKRTHCRLFTPENGGQTLGNALPGTVIDSQISANGQFDFYMCSHYGLKGTSKPTHYHVIVDDVGLKADEIQRFTFDLCHMYSRCTKIVSSPAPCHYAHLAAYSAHYNQPDFREKDEGDIKASRAAQPGELLHILPHLQDVLYYT